MIELKEETKVTGTACCHHDRERLFTEFGDSNTPISECVCTECGRKFVAVNATKEIAEDICDDMWNLINTTMTIWVDIPDETTVELCNVLETIKKFPEMFSAAKASMESVIEEPKEYEYEAPSYNVACNVAD